MPVLDVLEYNDIYYGDHPSLKHLAGYDNYDAYIERVHGTAPIDGSDTVFWGTDNERIGLSILNRYTNNNQKVMVVGCAKGHLVEWLISQGLDAYGIDVSSHAIQKGIERNPSLSGRIFQGDVKLVAPTWGNNEWDLLISQNTLCCFTDSQLTSTPNGLIASFNKKSRDQFHLISPGIEDAYYNRKNLTQWIALGWSQGTVIAQRAGVGFNFNYLVK